MAVRFGLQGIKQISDASSRFTEERDRNGPYRDLEEFNKRVGGFFNKAQYEVLCEAGAFDHLAKSRRQAHSVLTYLSQLKNKGNVNQLSMFDKEPIPAKILDVAEWGDVADREYKAVGFYFSQHPIDPYVPRLVRAKVSRRLSYQQYMKERKQEKRDNASLCVIVENVTVRQTNKTMRTYIQAFVAEKSDSYSINFFGSEEEVSEFRSKMEASKASRIPVVVVSSLNYDGNTTWVTGRKVFDVDEFLKDIRGDILVKLDPEMIRPTGEFHRRIQAINNSLANNEIPEQEAHVKIQKVKEELSNMKIKELLNWIEENAMTTENTGISVSIEVFDEKINLPYKYKMDSKVRGVLSSFAGVTSIVEYFAPVETAPVHETYDDDEEEEPQFIYG